MDIPRPSSRTNVVHWFRHRSDHPVSALAVDVYTGHEPGGFYAELGARPPAKHTPAPRPVLSRAS